jgi:ABC-type multidrug transport system ATPase subunit
MSRLGKQVIELVAVSKTMGAKPILSQCDFIIGPGDRLAILGENGSGKTTLIRLMGGTLAPDFGIIRIGKTVRMAYLSQQLEELGDLLESRVSDVLENNRRHSQVDGKLVSSTELLRRLGFERAYLLARVKDLSGGQKRRLQLLLTLLNEPNVIILDEPGNDFDTDMLVVLEDLLDSWPGTLILVSHDRYLIERVTDMQYALIDGALLHLPGGIDEYLKLANRSSVEHGQGGIGYRQHVSAKQYNRDTVSSARKAHEARKLLSTLERKMRTLENQISKKASELDAADQTDYVTLGKTQNELQELQGKLQELEAAWLELSEEL